MKKNIGSWVFVDLQKASDTVDHQILLAKLNHYGIRRVSNYWFKSYLPNCNQYISINGYESGFAALNCGFSQGSVLRPLLFLLYINDFKQTIKLCIVHHIADDNNLLCLSNSIKKLDKLVKGATKSQQKIIFLSATKNSRKHNQCFKILFFKLNSCFDPSN